VNAPDGTGAVRDFIETRDHDPQPGAARVETTQVCARTPRHVDIGACTSPVIDD
jgi:hypothetical protein